MNLRLAAHDQWSSGRYGQANSRGNTIRKTLAIATLAGITIFSDLIASTGQADAQFRRWGPVLGLGIAAGAIIANSGPYDVAGPQCFRVRQYDELGNYKGRTTVCNY